MKSDLKNGERYHNGHHCSEQKLRTHHRQRDVPGLYYGAGYAIHAAGFIQLGGDVLQAGEEYRKLVPMLIQRDTNMITGKIVS